MAGIIDPHVLRSGMITQTHKDALMCRGIEYVLGSTRCHNGIVTNRKGYWYIIDPVPPRVQLRPLAYWDEMIYEGYSIDFLWPSWATPEQGRAAAAFMDVNAVGTDYPELTAARLIILKFWQSFPWRIRSGHQYRDWCSLWVRDAWATAAHLDWSTKPDGREKLNPTPKTVQNRIIEGRLRVVASYGPLARAKYRPVAYTPSGTPLTVRPAFA